MDKKYQRNPQIEVAPLKDELLLFNAATNKFFVMNVTAAFLWERLAESAGEEALVGAIRSTFAGISGEQAVEDVKDTVKMMIDLGLLVESAGNARGLES